MDRLYAVAALALILFGACDDNAKAQAPSHVPSRVNAVVAKEKTAEAPEDFCDVYHADPATAVKFNYPELAAEAPPTPDGWRWVNVWATWCKPCVEEMPRLATWEKELDGLSDIVFLSADDSDEIVARFESEHAEVPASVRLASPDLLQPWLNELGLAGSPSLPVHLFVDASGATRCIRMGGVTDRDRGAVELVLQ